MYDQLYEGSGDGNRILWRVNLNEPTGNADWPQATEDTLAMPSTNSGKVWRYADSTYTNPNRTGIRSAAENQSPLINTGGLVGATVDMKRWTARMFIEADS